MITLDSTKNIGVVIQAKSGSTAMLQYLATLTGTANLMELFNAYNYNTILTRDLLSLRPGTPTPFDPVKALTPWVSPPDHNAYDLGTMPTRVQRLKDFNASGKLAVFKIYPNSYLPEDSTFPLTLADTNTQIILLDRADVLYSIISIFVSIQTRDWFAFTGGDRSIGAPAGAQYHLSVQQLTLALDVYKTKQDHINQYFPTAPRIYYEQFQDDLTQLPNLIQGPQGAVGKITLGKFTDNHKLLISNLAEVEACYQAYVTANPTYFPASTNKMPGVVIPASQGNQPT